MLARLERPRRMVITAGMPYANGPLHLGHLAGAHVPADIYARWCRLLIGADRVLFVNGTDDHGSTSELAAAQHGRPVAEFLDGIHQAQQRTLANYSISLDCYSGTSRPETFPRQCHLVNDFVTAWQRNGLLHKRRSRQWYDPQAGRFLSDRLVRGTCPNPRCGNPDAYGDECDRCGHQHDPVDLIDPRSTLSEARPELRETTHWHFNMWPLTDVLREWIDTKTKIWRAYTLAEVRECVLPSLRFATAQEEAYKAIAKQLPPHKRKYAPGKQVQVQCADLAALDQARSILEAAGISTTVADEWSQRSMTRDTTWGIPVTPDDPEIAGKTLYVWPDSLIAPIAFTQVALEQKGLDPESWRDYWCDPHSRVVQFLGQDNIYFYVLMQGAMWLAAQDDPYRLPQAGELQLTDIISNCHLMVNGEKMSKSRGTFLTGDQMLEEKGHSADQVRMYLALLALAERPSDFDLDQFAQRNAFLGGPLNAAFEKPISACHAHYQGLIPEGRIDDKSLAMTTRIVARYLKAMPRADYPSLLFEIENYARRINSLFAQHRPHDDRGDPTARADALFTSFFILKNLLIMLSPFAPETCERLRRSLDLPATVLSVDALGTVIPAGHRIAAQQTYFPATARRDDD